MSTILGAPVIGSNPHFYDAYQGYIDGVEGMKPNKTLHLTYLILEAVRNYKQNRKKNNVEVSSYFPNQLQRTNVLLTACKRGMLSFALSKTRLSATNNLNTTDVFVPMVWYEEVMNAETDFK